MVARAKPKSHVIAKAIVVRTANCDSVSMILAATFCVSSDNIAAPKAKSLAPHITSRHVASMMRHKNHFDLVIDFVCFN